MPQQFEAGRKHKSHSYAYVMNKDIIKKNKRIKNAKYNK